MDAQANLHDPREALYWDRNVIINGDMRIAQRGSSFTLNDAEYHHPVDRFRWYQKDNGFSTRPIVARSGDAPDGFSSSAQIENKEIGSAGADSRVFLSYNIEGYDSKVLHDKTGVLSFWVKSSKVGIYTVFLKGATWATQFYHEMTINQANVWEKKEIVIPFADSLIVWDEWTGIGIAIGIVLAVGSNKQTAQPMDEWVTEPLNAQVGSPNNVDWTDSATAIFRITGVKLEPGNTATPFVPRPYGQELALCQRYFVKINNLYRGSVIVTGANVADWGSLEFPTTMRVAPGMIGYKRVDDFTAVWEWTKGNVTAEYAPSFATKTVDGAAFYVSGISGWAPSVGESLQVRGIYEADAEL